MLRLIALQLVPTHTIHYKSALSDNGMALNTPQAITWINADIIPYCIWASSTHYGSKTRQ